MKHITIDECASNADNLAILVGFDEEEQKIRATYHVPGKEDVTVDQTADEFWSACGGDPCYPVAWCYGDGSYPDLMVFETLEERHIWLNQR